MSQYDRIDLHVHSRYSPDSRAPIVELVDRSATLGLRGMALTDHNSVAGHRGLLEVQKRFSRSLLIPGVEVSTREGHLLVLGVTEAPPDHRPLAETIDWARAHGGVAVPSHPLRWTHGIGRRAANAAAVPALETVNGHNGAVANARAELIAAQRHLGATGGSDAHDVRSVGQAFTEFPDGVSTVDDVLDQIARGRSRAGGVGVGGPARLRLALHTAALRVARGFRAV